MNQNVNAFKQKIYKFANYFFEIEARFKMFNLHVWL